MVKIIAHRGYKKKYPENTMLAFKKAVEWGADGIELDVQLSRDGEIIVLHDPTLNRTTNKKGAVRELMLAEIKKARIKGRRSERIPVLKEVLHYFKGTNYVVNIEIKSTETLLQDKVIELVAALGMTQQIIISSFYPEVIRRMKTLSTIETALLYTKYMDQPWLKQADLNFDGIHADTFYTSKAYIEYFLAHEQTVRIYTVNREQDLAYWLDSSIDAVITDDVELAVQLKNSSNEN